MGTTAAPGGAGEKPRGATKRWWLNSSDEVSFFLGKPGGGHVALPARPTLLAPHASEGTGRVGFAAPPRAGSLFKRFALALQRLPPQQQTLLDSSPLFSRRSRRTNARRARAESLRARVRSDPRAMASSSAAPAVRAESSSARAARGAGTGKREVAPFEDGQYVRLLNRGRGGYLFAEEAGRGVSIDRRRGMVNTAWAVQILETDTAYHVLLRGAYGRHLAVTRVEPCPGHRGCNAAQCIFDEPEDKHVMWWTTPGKNGSVVLLHGTSGNLRALRANGRYRRWLRCVTVEAINHTRVTSMMEWEVQVIPLRVERPPYQLRPGGADIQWCLGSQEIMEVSYIVADDNGSTNGRGWILIPFYGRSLIELGNELAHRLGNGVNFQDITLFIQAGNLGQPTLLLTDLPHRDDPVDIVVYRVGTPGHNQLRFPDLEA